jgi:superfamily II DNA or RNA helicase
MLALIASVQAKPAWLDPDEEGDAADDGDGGGGGGGGRGLAAGSSRRRSRATLVVCPMSLLDQWREEILRHTTIDAEDILTYYGDDRKCGTVIRVWVDLLARGVLLHLLL